MFEMKPLRIQIEKFPAAIDKVGSSARFQTICMMLVQV